MDKKPIPLVDSSGEAGPPKRVVYYRHLNQILKKRKPRAERQGTKEAEKCGIKHDAEKHLVEARHDRIRKRSRNSELKWFGNVARNRFGQWFFADETEEMIGPYGTQAKAQAAYNEFLVLLRQENEGFIKGLDADGSSTGELRDEIAEQNWNDTSADAESAQPESIVVDVAKDQPKPAFKFDFED